jgi:hypothetical protein
MMPTITVSVSDEIKDLMKKFDEINWSGFVKKSIEEKAQSLAKLEELRKQLKEEEKFNDWAVKTIRSGRSGRIEELKKKGLL